jgi:hypothetical protein
VKQGKQADLGSDGDCVTPQAADATVEAGPSISEPGPVPVSAQITMHSHTKRTLVMILALMGEL